MDCTHCLAHKPPSDWDWTHLAVVTVCDDRSAEEASAADIEELHQVIVEVADEQQQQELWERLKEEGYTVKLLTL